MIRKNLKRQLNVALFHRNTQENEVAQLYTVGLANTKLIVGLGNLGKKYAPTRHNVGFMCADRFAHEQDFPDWQEKRDLHSYVTKKTLGDSQILLIKPTTMMNASGKAVQAVAQFYKIPPSQIVVVHDELDVAFGQLKIKQGGGAAGHNGIKSIISHIGEDFGRIRVGIDGSRPEQMDTSDYVLARFTKDEADQLSIITREVSSILTEFVFGSSLTPETRSLL